MNRYTKAALGAATAVALMLPTGAVSAQGGTPTVPTTTEAPCHEDQPCWDCETMGNRVCGPLPPTVTVDEVLEESAESGMTPSEIVVEEWAEYNGTTTTTVPPSPAVSPPPVPVLAQPHFTG